MSPQPINVWPFIDGAYGAALVILAGMAGFAFRRYQRAKAQRAQVEKL